MFKQESKNIRSEKVKVVDTHDAYMENTTTNNNNGGYYNS